jgi:hypothetical protein
MTDRPRVDYWHLWVDAEGVSHQSRRTLTDFTLQGFAAGAAPQWVGAKTTGEASVLVTVLPVGWVGDWHPNPRPQWIVPLSGTWFVESMDAARVEMGPGELSFGGDQDAREVDGRRGHRSGTVGDRPAVLMLVQVAGEAPPAPCAFR